jgi:hypothetical protein
MNIIYMHSLLPVVVFVLFGKKKEKRRSSLSLSLSYCLTSLGKVDNALKGAG